MKNKVNSSDHYRALQSEVLPYELPLWFDSQSIHRIMSVDKKRDYLNSFFSIKNDSRRYIPLSYRIRRNESKTRTLSLAHPLAMLKVCEFYEDYKELIEYHCNRSSSSLRYPVKTASYFYGKKPEYTKSKNKIEIQGEEPAYSSSYFKYSKYPFLYKFFESYEYNQLEKKFFYLTMTDISGCFDNIYTHSIGWAIKGKEPTKKSIGNPSFHNFFDSLMQDLNNKETNGIIIGPEVSRVFSEIILQDIDNKVHSRLKEIYKLDKGIDFVLKRYVDDFFIFHNSKESERKIIEVINSTLSDYKLQINESKTKYLKRPFTTDITIAKNDIGEFIDSIEIKRTVDGVLKSVGNPSRRANSLISKLKLKVASHNVDYISISNFLVSSYIKSVYSYINKVVEEPDRNKNLLYSDLDILFFFHSMDLRVTTTDKICLFFVNLLNHLPSKSEVRDVLQKKFFDHCRQSIEIYINQSDKVNGIEILNLLATCTLLDKDFVFNKKMLLKYYEKLKERVDIYGGFYFIWSSFCIYCRNYNSLNSVYRRLIIDGYRFLLKNKIGPIDTEFYLLLFDISSCPDLPKNSRHKLFLKSLNRFLENPLTNRVINKQSWIFNDDFIIRWSSPTMIESSLLKKKFVFPYE